MDEISNNKVMRRAGLNELLLIKALGKGQESMYLSCGQFKEHGIEEDIRLPSLDWLQNALKRQN